MNFENELTSYIRIKNIKRDERINFKFKTNLSEIVKNLQKVQQPVQRSREWFEARRNMMTASDIASVLEKNDITCNVYISSFKLDNFQKDNKSCNPYSNKNDFILKKCGYGEFIQT